MDWSMLKSRATHRFLRDEVLYTEAIPVQYFPRPHDYCCLLLFNSFTIWLS